MPYVLKSDAGKTLEETYSGKEYVSSMTGKTECVAFVQMTVAGMVQTGLWKEGTKMSTEQKNLPAGTAIATFVDGKYPGPGQPKHAAIYLGQDADGIQVLDQWAAQGKVLKRTIRWVVPANTRISNDATKFAVIE